MSRRRNPRHTPEGFIRFTMECDGDQDHAVERIAKVVVKPRPDLAEPSGVGYAVTVEYVRLDMDPEDNDYTMPNRTDHMTRRFLCSDCGRDVPLTDDHLGRVALMLNASGQRRVRLRELSG